MYKDPQHICKEPLIYSLLKNVVYISVYILFINILIILFFNNFVLISIFSV